MRRALTATTWLYTRPHTATDDHGAWRPAAVYRSSGRFSFLFAAASPLLLFPHAYTSLTPCRAIMPGSSGAPLAAKHEHTCEGLESLERGAGKPLQA